MKEQHCKKRYSTGCKWKKIKVSAAGRVVETPVLNRFYFIWNGLKVKRGPFCSSSKKKFCEWLSCWCQKVDSEKKVSAEDEDQHFSPYLMMMIFTSTNFENFPFLFISPPQKFFLTLNLIPICVFTFSIILSILRHLGKIWWLTTLTYNLFWLISNSNRNQYKHNFVFSVRLGASSFTARYEVHNSFTTYLVPRWERDH